MTARHDQRLARALDALDGLRLMSPLEGAPRIDVGAKPKRSVARPAAGAKPRALRLTAETPYERDVLKAVLAYLRLHPAVAWVGRVNSGGATDERGQFMRFHTIIGCSDLIGQLKTGQFLACEIKRPGERPTEAQAAFLALVHRNGGCAGWADSVDAAERMMRVWAGQGT